MSDVTFWGTVALVCWGFAVLAANVSGLLPANVVGVLHSSRLEGGTINQLRTQVAALEMESQRVRRESNLLLQRFTLAEQASGDVTRRVGALEISVPQLLERAALAPAVDRAMTGSIGDEEMLTFPAQGGSVSVTQRPLASPGAPERRIIGLAEGQSADPVADAEAFGLALGFPVVEDEARSQWQDLNTKVGTLLLDLVPLLGSLEGSDGRQIVAGPVASRTEADQLCSRMDRVGIPCVPVPFVGTSLPLQN